MSEREKQSVQKPVRRQMPWGDLPRANTAAAAGIVLVDKDAGVTSHDVVGAIRRLAGTRKVGHAGTLDPMATGLLTLGIGRATKLLHYLTGFPKTYRATICLGVDTDTEDADGVIYSPSQSQSARLLQLKTAEIDQAIAAFTGKIRQVPSSFSAVKISGKRAYELSRAGQKVELPAREVTIYRFQRCSTPRISRELFDFPVLTFEVEVSCSAGTYIRALARDLGRALNVGAHLRMLRRTAVHLWQVTQAHSVAQINATLAETGVFPVISLDQICHEIFPSVEVSEAEAAALAHGQFITYRQPRASLAAAAFAHKELAGAEFFAETPKIVAAFNQVGQVLALLSQRGKFYKPDLQLCQTLEK